MRMILGIEEGASGLWYIVSLNRTGLYKGLLIAEKTLDEALDKIGPTVRAIREAAQQAELEGMKDVGSDDSTHNGGM